ncbi:hypothetical protein M5K25_004073 [Dendrobium thyrsiflorum]|uniref:Uncharacterized protein n=1 Tax=Dendrobium thyrsiflorum TaxID=117978 RepID=A0ABD0VSH1_DENTH
MNGSATSISDIKIFQSGEKEKNPYFPARQIGQEFSPVTTTRRAGRLAGTSVNLTLVREGVHVVLVYSYSSSSSCCAGLVYIVNSTLLVNVIHSWESRLAKCCRFFVEPSTSSL